MAQTGLQITGLREVIRDLQRVGVEVADLKGAFADIASRGAAIAASLAPRRTGKLAASVKGNKAKNKAVVKAGSARVPYAGAINYGWPKRNIAASNFMQRADEAIQPHVVPALEAALNRIIRERGLN